MYTPKQLKLKYGNTFTYEPPEELMVHYELLRKYELLDKLDEMVFEAKIEITVYLQEFTKVTDEDRMAEFFEGVDMSVLDLLNGDLSEIAPVIHDRVKLYLVFNRSTVRETLGRFIGSQHILHQVYIDYFKREG